VRLPSQSAGNSRRHLSAIVFDMDGTLVDSVAAVLNAYATTVQTLTGRRCTAEEVTEKFSVGPGLRLLTALLGRRCRLADLKVFESRVQAEFPNANLYPGIGDMVARAAAQVPVALCTGTDRRTASLLLDNAGLLPHFSTLVCGDDVTAPKPSPEGLLMACHRLGVPPQTAAYLGDSPFDAQAARAGGLLAVTAAWGHQYDPRAGTDVVLREPRSLVELVTTQRPASPSPRPVGPRRGDSR
jgi:HAD superfamily hydrolase (TIGR01509 family)